MRWLCLLLVAVSCTKRTFQEEEIRPVLTETVEYYEGNPPLIFSGFSKAKQFINTSFRVGGMINFLPIKVGDRLQPGSVIAQLDQTDFYLRLQRAEATLEESQAEFRRASAQYKRIKTLYESESASRDELDTARAAFESAKALVEQSTSELDLARKEMSYTTLYAEQNQCEVSTKEVEVNENVEAGQTIATLTCGCILEVEVAVPESEIAKIEKGKEVTIYFNTLPGIAFAGRVEEVGVAAVAGATFPVTITLLEPDDRLRSGMAVKALIPRPAEEGQMIVVPLEAVGEDKEGNFVYIFDNGIAKKRKVEIGDLLPDGVVITSGLQPKEELIIAGLRYLYDGKKVKKLENTEAFKKKRT